MAKGKNGDSVPNKHLYSRISYLHQAATYLASQSPSAEGQQHQQQQNTCNTHDDTKPAPPPPSHNLARQLVADIRTVGRKVLIRPSPRMKQTLCKHCDSVLIEGKSCVTSVENPSRGGRKPWADVLVVRCRVCDNVRRYPVSAPRQKRKGLREAKPAEAAEG